MDDIKNMSIESLNNTAQTDPINTTGVQPYEYGGTPGTTLEKNAQELMSKADVLESQNRELLEADGITGNWWSDFKSKVKEFSDKVLPKNIDYKKVGGIVLAGAMVTALVSGCAPKPVNADTVPTANATDTLGAKAQESQVGTNNTGVEEVPPENIYPTPAIEEAKSPVPEPEKTATVEVEPLNEDFGLESSKIYSLFGNDVDSVMKNQANGFPDFSYDYIVYTSNEQFGSLYSEGSLNKVEILDWLEKYRGEDEVLIIREEKVFESVMGSGLYSDYSVKDRHQMVVLVTEEEGEDGIVRNAFYSYSSDGIVVFVDEDFNNRTLVWKGSNIDTKDPQIRDLIEEGYSNIRKKDGKYFAIGKKVGDLPQRNNISLGN